MVFISSRPQCVTGQIEKKKFLTLFDFPFFGGSSSKRLSSSSVSEAELYKSMSYSLLYITELHMSNFRKEMADGGRVDLINKSHNAPSLRNSIQHIGGHSVHQ